jgi:hypothetical protein
MELKLFGKKIFEFSNNKGQYLINDSVAKIKESEFLPDFLTFRVHDNYGEVIQFVGSTTEVVTKKEKNKTENELTPKDVYKMQMLNDKVFKMKTDKDYIDKNIADFTDKLNIIKTEEYDMSRGSMEIGSIIMRLENRKKYPQYVDFFEQYAYTSTDRINELIKNHEYLKLGKIAQFLADMPKEAVDTIKDYDKKCKELCDKKAVYYIVANKEDFEKSDKRRDPILLAQSPFGHFWQILGAWDEEMLLINEL